MLAIGIAGCAGLGDKDASGPADSRAGVDAPLAAPATALTLTGHATDAATGAALYTESHEIAAGGLKETIRYTSPDGKSLGEKTVDYTGAPFAPLYRLRLTNGYSEGATARTPDGRGLTLAYDPRRGPPQTARVSVDDTDPLIVDEGLPRFVADRLPSLARGESFTFHLAVAPQLDSYRLRLSKIADTTVDGRPAVTAEVGADSFLLSLLSQPAQATYDLATRRVLRYEGVSSIRNPRTGKVYDRVRIDYDPPVPASGAGADKAPAASPAS